MELTTAQQTPLAELTLAAAAARVALAENLITPQAVVVVLADMLELAVAAEMAEALETSTHAQQQAQAAVAAVAEMADILAVQPKAGLAVAEAPVELLA